MYYAHFILSKKGPLAKIWLAAHWDKKLTKAQIYETNIESTIETILEPQMNLALRTSGHLLLGVCRIYSRKVKYLLADCNEAFVKIKMAFRPGLVDATQPREKQQASIESITLQEKLPDIDMNILMSVDINMDEIDMSTNLMANQARIEDITLKEDYVNSMVVTQEDDFGDMDFGMNNFAMNDFEFGTSELDERQRDESRRIITDEIPSMISELIEPTEDGDDKSTRLINEDKMDIDSIVNDDNHELNAPPLDCDNLTAPNIDITCESTTHLTSDMGAPILFEDQTTASKIDEPHVEVEVAEVVPSDIMQTVTNQVAQQGEKYQRPKRKKKLIVDDIKEINSATMKAQLSDTSDIVASLELAPPTRRLMELKDGGYVERLFKSLSRPLNDHYLMTQFFTTNMITRNEADFKIKHKQQQQQELKSQTSKFTSSFLAANGSTLGERQREQNESLMVAQVNNDMLPLMDSIVEQQHQNDNLSKISAPQVLTDDATLTDYNNQSISDLPPPPPNDSLSLLQSNTSLDESHVLAKQLRVRKTLEMTPVMDTNIDEQQSSQKSRRTSQRRSAAPTSFAQDDTIVEESQPETNEEDSALGLTKRSKTMISLLNRHLSKHSNIGFFELTKRNGRKQVAQKFYSLLVLKKLNAIDVTQADAYEDLIISKTDKFDNFSTNC